jgi:hypothetical protein
MTLLQFVHWTNVFFDSSLRLEIFHDFSTWKKECKTLYECDNTNGEFTNKGSDAVHMKMLLRGSQAMTTGESMLEHADDWNIVNHVFKWLIDYTEDSPHLDGISPGSNDLDITKTRLAAVLTKGRITEEGTKGLLM